LPTKKVSARTAQKDARSAAKKGTVKRRMVAPDESPRRSAATRDEPSLPRNVRQADAKVWRAGQTYVQKAADESFNVLPQAVLRQAPCISLSDDRHDADPLGYKRGTHN
jgi:hypothetical protein